MIVKRLQLRRMAKGLTIREVYDTVGIPPSTWAEYERSFGGSVSEVSPKDQRRITGLLGGSMDRLWQDVETPKYDVSLGDLIRGSREYKGFTRHDLEGITGIRRATWYNWERGSAVPQVHQIPILATLLDLSAEHLAVLILETGERPYRAKHISVEAL